MADASTDVCQLKNLFHFPDAEVDLNISFPSEKITSDTSPFSNRRNVLMKKYRKLKIAFISKSACISISMLIVMKSIAA